MALSLLALLTYNKRLRYASSYASCLGVSSDISAQFTLEMCVAAQNRKKICKNSLFWGFNVI